MTKAQGLVLLLALSGLLALPLGSTAATAQAGSSSLSTSDRQLVRRYAYMSQAAQVAERENGNALTANLRRRVQGLQSQLRTKETQLREARDAARMSAAEIRQLEGEIVDVRRQLAEAIEAGNLALLQLSEGYARALRQISGEAEILLQTEAGRRAFELVAAGGDANRAQATELINAELLAEDEAAERVMRMRRAARYRSVAAFYIGIRGSGRATTEEIRRLLEEVVANDPSNFADWLNLAQIYLDAGTLDPALHAAEQALLHARDTRARSAAFTQMGDVLYRRDDAAAAMEAHARALEMDRQAARASPNDDEAQLFLVVSLERMGDRLRDQGNRAGALELYREALALSELRLAEAPADIRREANVAVGHSKIGYMLMLEGDHQGARLAIDQAIAIEQRLAAAPDAPVSLRRNYAVSLDLSGDLFGLAEDHRRALQLYTQALDIRLELLDNDPGWLELRRVVVLSLTRTGDARDDLQDVDGAIRDYEQGLRLIEQLSVRSDASPLLLRDRSVLTHRLADIRIRRNEFEEARSIVLEGYETDQRLARANPSVAAHQRDIAVGLTRLAMLGVPGFTWARAVDQFRMMEQAGQLLPEDRAFFEEVSRLADEEGRR